MQWFVNSPRVDLGFLPSFLSEADPRPAAEQIHANYTHGGGWNPRLHGQSFDPVTLALTYPGDPPLYPSPRPSSGTRPSISTTIPGS